MSSGSSKPVRRSIVSTAAQSRHRRKSHEEAHAGSEAVATPILAHAMVPQGPPKLIADGRELDVLLQALREAGMFGFDTEFIGEATYSPKLCLIQTATVNDISLIDPLADVDLRGFWELIADPTVVKVVHAGMQDLEPVVRLLNKPPRNVFDTQIGAGFIGQPHQMGMGNLAERLLGVKPAHGVKFSQWDGRPLTNAQLRYAADDVRYLPLLMEKIVEKARELGNEAWMREEMGRLEHESQYVFDPAKARMRVRGVEHLTPRQRSIGHVVLLWREDAAQKHDVPPRQLMNEEVVATLARMFETRQCAVDDLTKVKGLPRPVRQELGHEIAAAVNNGRTCDIEDWMQAPPDWIHDDELRPAVETTLKSIRVAAETRKIDVGLVTSKKEMFKLMRAFRRKQSTANFRVMSGWRSELTKDALQDFARNS
ncbi:MAG TPA: hypothetical protein VG711_09505 [Phycisphaerales bacterium]|nr:hypothetical protein [Phycisphaerales bacterium]